MPRAVLPRLVAVLVAAAGLVLLVVGVSRAGSSAAATDIVGRLPKVGQQVVVTAPGMTELAGSTLRVQASSADPARPVFIGVGRADDVEAYLGSSGRVETTALDSAGVLRVSVRGNGSLPDPASVDVWAAAVRSQGAATLTWPRTPGAWRLVVTTDGTAPPAAVQFTWSGSSGSSPAPALIAVGLVLLIAGVVALLAIRSGRIFTGGSGRNSIEVARSRARQQRQDRSAARAASGPPATSGPSASEPRAAAEPRPVDPNVIDPNLIDPNLIDPDVIEADVIEADVIEVGETEPARTEPAAAEAAAGEPVTKRTTEAPRRSEPPDRGAVADPAARPAGHPRRDGDEEDDEADEAPVVVQPFRRRGQGGGPQ